MKIKDFQADGSNYETSLVKLTGKRIKDVKGYLANEFGSVSFKLTELVFEDGSEMGIEGEHDFPYLTTYPKHPQPNFDEETLETLYAQND